MRGLVPALVLSLAVGLFAGCGSSNNNSQSEAPAQSEAAGSTTAASSDNSGNSGNAGTSTAASGKDSLIIATANETPSVTTNLHNAVAGDYLNNMTHNGLFYTSDDLSPQPALCESYEIVSDTEWIFHLKQGVKFHNGTEMTAKDVKASLDICLEA